MGSNQCKYKNMHESWRISGPTALATLSVCRAVVFSFRTNLDICSVFGGLVKGQVERSRFLHVQIMWNTRHKITSRCWYKQGIPPIHYFRLLSNPAFLCLPFFPVVLASLLILLAVVQNFYKKEIPSSMFIKRQPMKIIN